MKFVKCDHCGKFVPEKGLGVQCNFDRNKITYANSIYVNFSIYNITPQSTNDKRDGHAHRSYDLCNDCLKEIIEFLADTYTKD